MNECEQIHPLLRGYLEDSLSARDRRVVARHLNLCASARKELDRLRSGPVRTPASPSDPPSEPWDLKVLRWLFKTKKPGPARASEGSVGKKRGASKQALSTPLADRSSSPWRSLLGIVVFFVFLVLLTHFVQNAGDNSVVKGAKRWLSKNGYNVLGVTPSLDLVLDLTNLPHWTGNSAPVAVPCRQLVTDQDHFKFYWQLLQPRLPMPSMDFGKNALAVVFVGPKTTAGYGVRFKVMKNYSDRTVLEYDEVPAPRGEIAMTPTNSWVLQVVPKPAQQPVLIQKAQ
jgi:hypothetical protein